MAFHCDRGSCRGGRRGDLCAVRQGEESGARLVMWVQVGCGQSHTCFQEKNLSRTIKFSLRLPEFGIISPSDLFYRMNYICSLNHKLLSDSATGNRFNKFSI